MLLDCSAMCHSQFGGDGLANVLLHNHVWLKPTDTRIRCSVILIIKTAHSSKKKCLILNIRAEICVFETCIFKKYKNYRYFWFQYFFLKYRWIDQATVVIFFFTRVSTMIERFCMIKMLTWLQDLWMCVWLLSVSHHSPPHTLYMMLF